MNYFNTYFLNVLKNQYTDFKGRATRSQFWYFTLFCFILNLIFDLIGSLLMNMAMSEITWNLLKLVWSLALLFPSLAIAARRLHDTDKSGWWQLLMFIPLVGIIILLVFFCLPSQADKNRFGEPVK